MKKAVLFSLLGCLLSLQAALPANGNFSQWNGNKPANWSLIQRNDRPNTCQKINGGIRIDGMLISERFKLPGTTVKITLKTKSVKNFLKVYLFQYMSKDEKYFKQCGQAFDLQASSTPNTLVTTLKVGMQGQRYAAFAFDGSGAEVESVTIEEMKVAKSQYITREIPVIFNSKAPRMDGKYHPEDWKNSFVFRNPFISIAQKVNFFDGETVKLQSDGKNFYMLLKTPNARKGTRNKRDGECFLDSSVELIFQPAGQKRQFHLIANFNGGIFDEEIAVGQKFVNWNCPGVRTSVCADGKDTILIFAVPFKSVAIDPAAGWQFNICRNRPEVSEYASMNGSGYLKDLMNGKLVKDMSACSIDLIPAGREFTFRAKADKSVLAVREIGGEQFNASKDATAGVDIKSSRPQIPDGAFDITLTKDGKTCFRTEARFGKMTVNAPAKETVTQLIYYPIQKKVAVVFHGISFKQRDNLARVECQIGGKKVVLDKFAYYDGYVITQKPFAIPKDGTYPWQLKVIQKDGKVMEENSGSFTSKKSFEWLGNNYGKDRIIVPPFTKMTVSGNTVGCIMRDTRFGANGFPESVIAAGKEVLSAPIKLYAVMEDGKEIPFKGKGFRITSKADDRIEFKASNHAGNLSADLTGWMEYDGVSYYTMNLNAAKPTNVRRVYLEIPYEQADLFHIVGPSFRSYPHSYRTREMKGDGVIWKSSQSAIGSKVFGSFLPSLWLGSFRNGFSFFAESDRNWINSRKSNCYELIRRNGKLVLRVNFVAKKAKLQGNRKLEFGFVATPLKKREVGADQYFNWSTSFARTFFNKGLMSLDPVISNMMLNKERKSSYVVYTAGQEYIEGDPEFQAVSTEFDPDYKPGWNPWEIGQIPRRNGGMVYADYTSRYAVWNPYRVDFALWRLEKLLRETDVDGIYQDNSYSSFSNNLLLKDQGFVREDGRVQGVYHLLSQREYLKRAAVLTYKYGKRYPRVVLHNTGTIMPAAYAFADGFFDGEMDYKKYYQTFYIPWNEVFLGVDWGLTPGRLTMNLISAKGQNRALFSVFKLYDMRFWVTHPGFDNNLYGKIRKAEKEFGIAAPGTKFFGYWQEESPVKAVGKTDLVASCFQRKDGNMIVYIGNQTDKAASGTFQFGAGKKAYDLFTGKPVTFPVTIPGQDFMGLYVK